MGSIATVRSKNILCLCTDDNGDGNALMLLSIDHRNGGLKLSSFLPSLKVKAADNTEQILSALFQKEENGDEAVSLIQQNFGLAVDGYIWMDSSAVEAAIDAMGGVTLELSEEEARYFALSSSFRDLFGWWFCRRRVHIDRPTGAVFWTPAHRLRLRPHAPATKGGGGHSKTDLGGFIQRF